MTFLPIVQRELLEASRRRGTYWIRVGIATVGLLIGVWVMFIPELRVPSRIGLALFVPLTIVALLYCALVGIFRTADCLSEEKREGTLGLLFLTDLKGYDIVFGKLVATSLNAVYGVLALFPVLAISLLAGGVTLAEFGRVVLVSLNTLFFSLAVGMFCSAVSRDERKAMGLATVLILFFVVGVPIICSIVEDALQWRGSGVAEVLALPSPSFSAMYAFDAPRRGGGTGASLFFVSVLTVHLISWLLLVIGAFVVPRTWQDRPLSAAALRRRQKLQGFGAAPVERQVGSRRQRLAINPVFWLVTRGRLKMIAVWGALALGAFIWMLGLIWDPSDWRDEFPYVLTALIAHTLLRTWLVTEACRQFSLDRQSGALELLLSTPLPAREIVRGQVLGLEKQFAGPIFAVLLVDVVFLLAGPRNEGWTALWLLGMIVFLADVFALAWMGMWRGLNSRRPNRAASAALLRVLVLPWILIGLIATAIEVLNLDRYLVGGNWGDYGFPLLYLVVSLGVDALFGLPARSRLLQRFREVATQRYETRGRGRAGANS
jgi:ABC-type transport system involved in cytochrome c biogenesis permease component